MDRRPAAMANDIALAGQRANLLHSVLSEKGIVLFVLIVIFGVLVVPPLYFLLQGALTVEENGVTRVTLERFSVLLAEGGLFTSIMNSFLFAIGSAIFALVIGGTAAWLVERTDAPFKSLTYITTLIALGTPYVLYTSSWLMILARSGPVNSFFRHVTGSSDVLINVYGFGGMILIEGLIWAPLVFMLLCATLRNFNPELEEAARMCGADAWRTVRRITFRLSMPSVLALSMLVVVRTVEAFEVPALVGMPAQVRVLTTDIYQLVNRTIPPDMGTASAMSMILLLIVVGLLYFYGRLTRNAERFATVTGKSFRPNLFQLGKWRPVAGAILILNFALLVVLPLLMLAWVSLLPFYQGVRLSALPLLSLVNYGRVLNTAHYGSLIFNTLVIAGVTATLVMTVTALAAWLSVRNVPGSRVLDQLGIAPLAIPSMVLGVGVMQFFLALPIGVYGTIWIVAWALIINYLPFGARYSHAGMLQLHRELEEAAAMSGASPLHGFYRIVLPLLGPAILAGWLFIFLLSTRALSLPVLLSGPGSQTISVAMFDLWANGQAPELAAFGLMWTAAMTVLAMLLHIVVRRGGLGQGAV